MARLALLCATAVLGGMVAAESPPVGASEFGCGPDVRYDDSDADGAGTVVGDQSAHLLVVRRQGDGHRGPGEYQDVAWKENGSPVREVVVHAGGEIRTFGPGDGGFAQFVAEGVITHVGVHTEVETCPPRGPDVPGAPAPLEVSCHPENGYWLAGADGGVFDFGNASFAGSGQGEILAPVVGMAGLDTSRYRLATADGAVESYGELQPFGSLAGVPLNAPVVDIEAIDEAGYWLAAADGGVFEFGHAQFLGSAAGVALNEPIVAMAAESDSAYWLVGRDGGVFNFGYASFYGSTGAIELNAPIVDAAATHGGYWLVAADGGVFTFGSAGFYGSTGGMELNQPIVAIVVHQTGQGYWLVAADGGVFAFGAAEFCGSTANIPLSQPIAAASATFNAFVPEESEVL